MKLKSLLLIMLTYLFAFSASARVIFETDFANDGNFFATGSKSISFTNLPEGFDGIRTNQGIISGAPGEGVGGSVALKFQWPAQKTALATSLFKHLTGKRNTGLKEIYVRYRVKLPSKFKAGTEGGLPYWKWGRLWQNAGLNGDGWTENRPDSYYVMWQWGNGLPKWGIKNNIIMGQNLNTDSKGSAGGPRTLSDWHVRGGNDSRSHHVGLDGHWDSVGAGAWEFDHTTRNLIDAEPQKWHTFEWHFKLSTTDTSNDGIFQVWFDGVEQHAPNPVEHVEGNLGKTQGVDKPSRPNSLITAAKPGFNLFTLFDNMAEWSKGWNGSGVEGAIYINDLVISTSRIGHSYFVGEPPPKPPTGLIITQ